MTIQKDPETGKYPECAKHLHVTFNGTRVEHICQGASEEEGWADLMLASQCGPSLKLSRFIIQGGMPVVVRVHGKVEIVDSRVEQAV